MTNPPPPPASAMGLVAEWLQRPDHYDANESRDWFTWLARAGCAHELSAALSLSEEEREAIRDARQAVRFGDPVTDYTAGLLLAIITRTYGETP